MNTLIVIPARYGSTRFPGKPLAMLGGQSMLSRVVDIAKEAAAHFSTFDHIKVAYVVATDDQRIADHAREIGAACIMTPASCKTGSDRALAAVRQLDHAPDFIINLQGDAPFTPPSALIRMIERFTQNKNIEVITPVCPLSWAALDRLRESKKSTPFSGTTAIVDPGGNALWFSKNIIPAIREEDNLRKGQGASPVFQHIGLYGFRYDILEKFCALPQSVYEQVEGLEQLRLLENGIRVQTISLVCEDGLTHGGIDTPEDLKRAEKFFS